MIAPPPPDEGIMALQIQVVKPAMICRVRESGIILDPLPANQESRRKTQAMAAGAALFARR
jgi:hypothetical protein